MPQSLISLSHVHYDVEGTSILQDISLEVMKGKITTIIGPNGAGKTTLLRLMLGLANPTAGDIHRHVHLIGYMPQKIFLNPLMPLTVERFLQLSQPDNNQQLNQKIKDVLHEVGACHLENRFMRVLSGGELQRILLARSLMLNADLLILDEPAQGVDVMGQADLYDMIAKIRDNRGCGIVLVSHDLHLVMAASDEVVCLNHHVCCSGHPISVQQDPKYLELFKSQVTPPDVLYPEALAVYTHHHDHHHDDGVLCEHGPHEQSSKEDSQ